MKIDKIFRCLYIKWRAGRIRNYRVLRWDEYLETIKNLPVKGDEKANNGDYGGENAQNKKHSV